jgi:hypothetical protein
LAVKSKLKLLGILVSGSVAAARHCLHSGFDSLLCC